MPNLFDLEGKVAIVTGSSRGIGKAIVSRLAEHGARVVVSSRKGAACAAVAEEINARYPGQAAAIPANVSSKSDLEALVAKTRDRFGRIDSLICNAATNIHYGPMHAIGDDVFRKTLENNVLSAHWLAGLVAPEMMARGEGTIILVASIGGFLGSKTIGAYNLTKAALLQLARNLAVELGPHGIRTNCISPGHIKTDFSRVLWNDEAKSQIIVKDVPLGRAGEPDDIAGAAILLASAAGRYINGQTIVIDGGLTVGAAGI